MGLPKKPASTRRRVIPISSTSSSKEDDVSEESDNDDQETTVTDNTEAFQNDSNDALNTPVESEDEDGKTETSVPSVLVETVVDKEDADEEEEEDDGYEENSDSAWEQVVNA